MMSMFRSESKYNNKITYYDGIRFDSKAEMQHYCELELLKKAGVVKDIQRQVSFQLQPGYTGKDGKKVKAITYKADFVVTYSDGHKEVIDVKGHLTEVYKLKKKMLLYIYPDIDFKEVYK